MHNDATGLLTTAQVAQLTSFHVSTIRRFVQQKYLPAVRLLSPGAKKPSLRFRREEVEAWLARQSADATTGAVEAGAGR